MIPVPKTLTHKEKLKIIAQRRNAYKKLRIFYGHIKKIAELLKVSEAHVRSWNGRAFIPMKYVRILKKDSQDRLDHYDLRPDLFD